MPKRLTVAEHLSLAELETRGQTCADEKERRRWLVLWLLAAGHGTAEASSVTGFSLAWIRRLLHRYNAEGEAAVGDARRHNRGAAPLLAPEIQAELAAALKGPAVHGGPWTSRDVVDWIEQRTGLRTHLQRGWAYLKRLS
jgi:transposase